ncbi:MAG: DUF2149 domain-containing protein [Actinomycetota bacterium]|nr:DUF2149 domain-containing protein [Actinomycetota bacterium]
MIEVTRHARRREDRAGDPLDGLVNLFDLGIVLSVAFLLAALSSLHLTGTLRHGLRPGSPSAIVIPSGSRVAPLPPPGATTIGPGTEVGVVYRLADGRLVYVQKPPATGTTTSPLPGPATPQAPGTTPPQTPGTTTPQTTRTTKTP